MKRMVCGTGYLLQKQQNVSDLMVEGVQLWEGPVLLDGGAVAVHPDCCCIEHPVYDCTYCDDGGKIYGEYIITIPDMWSPRNCVPGGDCHALAGNFVVVSTVNRCTFNINLDATCYGGIDYVMTVTFGWLGTARVLNIRISRGTAHIIDWRVTLPDAGSGKPDCLLGGGPVVVPFVSQGGTQYGDPTIWTLCYWDNLTALTISPP